MKTIARLVTCLWLLACAPEPRPNTRATGFDSASVYSAGVPGAACFVADASSPALQAAVESSAAARGVTLHGDARLGQLARMVLRGDPTPPTARFLELSARQLGVFDPSIDALIVPVKGDATRSLSQPLAAKLDERRFTHYGAALVDRDGERWLALALSTRRIALAPVPRSIATGRPIRLRGKLGEGLEHPRVDLLADGAQRTVLPLGGGREFDLQLPTPRAGLYRIEIVADTKLGQLVLAKLPVYVGIPAPTRFVFEADARSYDLGALRAAMFAGLNRERARAALPLLAADGKLDAIAAQHSLDMSEHAFVGHESERSGDPKQRVSRAGLSPGLVLETIAQASDPESLQASVQNLSGEGRNVLARGVTHVGIGIVVMPDAHGPTFLATEIFAELLPAFDLATATPRLLSFVNAARIRRGIGTLPLDEGLSEVARRAARSFMADANASEQTVIDDANRELGKFSLSYRRVSAVLAVTPRLEDAAALEPALDPQAAGLGLGIAAGERAGQGATLAIVLIVGEQR